MEPANIPTPPSWKAIRAAGVQSGFGRISSRTKAIKWTAAPGRHWWSHVDSKYRLFAYPLGGTAEKNHETKEILEAVASALEPLGYKVPRILASFDVPSPRGAFNVVARSHIRGTTFYNQIERLTSTELKKAYYQYGQLLGHIHTRIDPHMAPVATHSWNKLFEARPSEQQINAFACIMGLLKPAAQTWTQFMEATADDFNYLGGKPVFCHGDYNEWNVIMRQKKIIAPFDFELTNRAPRALEFSHITVPNPDLQPILDGYNAVTGLSVSIRHVEAARIRSLLSHAAARNVKASEATASLRTSVRGWLKCNNQSYAEQQRYLRALGFQR